MKRLLSTILVVFCFLSATATLPDIKFRRLDTRDGLSNSQVNCIYRDSHGFVWLGTSYGLNRYDGYRFRTFYSDATDTTSLRNNYIDGVMETADGMLIVKQGMNYTLLNPTTEKCERNPQVYFAKLGIKGGVDRVFVDNKRNLWVKTYDEGIYCYHPDTKKLSLLHYGYGDSEYPKEAYVSSFDNYADGILIATTNGQVFYIESKDCKIGWRTDYPRKNGGWDNQAYDVHTDKHGNYWLLTQGNAYIYIKRWNKWFHSVTDYLNALDITSPVDHELIVWDVATDNRGWIWMATDHDGLVIADPKTKEVRQYVNNRQDETSICENTLKHMYIDTSDRVWIGSYRNGISLYMENLSNIRLLEVGDVNAITEDTNGFWWFGMNDRGIIRYNPATDEQTLFNKANSGIASDVMVASKGTRDGSVWFGTYNGGLIRYHDGHFTNYLNTGDTLGLNNNNVWSVTEDRWGNIWIGTLGNGIQRLDVKTGRFKSWSTRNSVMKSDYMTTLSWTDKGWLLAGNTEYYLILNPKTGKIINREIPVVQGQMAAMAATTDIMQDSRGLIWQGSTAGVCIFDEKTKQQWLIDMNGGLFGSSVVGIKEDKRNTMWVSTEHGVSNVVPKKLEDGTWQFVVRSFNSRDGIQQGTHNQRSTYVTRSGLVLIGGQDGVDIIDPSHLGEGRMGEKPIFSGLQLFDRDVRVGERIDGRIAIDEALNICRSVDLRYNDQFTIQLASSSGEIHNQSRFVYRLEGFNDNWVRTSELNPNITYNSLRPGNYILYVRMLNDDGTMGDEESQLEITIRPPLWRTRWMVLVYMLLIAAAAWWWRKWWMKRQLKRMHVESIRRDLEKQQWMNEMRLQLAKENAEQKGKQNEPQTAVEEITLNKKNADIVDFVRKQTEGYKPEITDRRLRLNFLTAVREMIVDFDAEKIGDVLRTLFHNSVKFSPNDCTISVGVARTANDCAQIQVADNGIGIRDEYKEHAFDPIVNGEGIGLDRVRDIITRHGGDIRIEDNPGGGTIFVITLPQGDVIEEAEIIDEPSNNN